MRCEIATIEKRWPSRQALASAASVRPVTGTRQRLAQSGEARVAERRDDDRVVARVVLGRELRGGVGADQRLEARLDVGHAERRRQHVDLGARRRRAPRLGADQVRDAVRDVGVDQQQLHAARPVARRGSRVGGPQRRKRPRPARAWKSLPSHTTSPRARVSAGQAFSVMPS